MDREELIFELEKLQQENSDVEANHLKADELLLKYINDEEVTLAFLEIERWYT